MKPSQILTVLVVVLVGAFILRDALRPESPVQIAARDTMRIIEVRRDTVRDTIRVKEKAKARVDTLVRVVNDTQIVVRDSLVTVPALVVERIVTDSSLIASYRVDRRLDSLWHIQDAKLPHRPPRKWSLGAAAGYACTDKGCGPGIALGLTWRP